MTTKEQVIQAMENLKQARNLCDTARSLMVDIGAPTFDVLKLQKRMVKLDRELTALKKHFGSKIGAYSPKL